MLHIDIAIAHLQAILSFSSADDMAASDVFEECNKAEQAAIRAFGPDPVALVYSRCACHAINRHKLQSMHVPHP